MALMYFTVLLLFVWSQAELTLTNPVCSQWPIVEHASASVEYQRDHYQKGEVIYFSCDSGYITSSETSYVCTENGWRQQSFSQCIDDRSFLRDVSVRLTELQNQVEELKKINHDQATELQSLKKWMTETEQSKEVSRVAFSASLVASSTGTVGPFANHSRLLFKNVYTNLKNAYDPDTGKFTAPVRGVYHFEFHVATGGGSAGAVVALVKNTFDVICTATARDSGNGLSTTGNEISLNLEVGDTVQVNLTKNRQIYENESHHCTFSGRLLFPA